MGEIHADVPFKVIFDGGDVAFWNIPLNKHYWVIEKDKPIPHSFFDLQDDINSLIEENKQLKIDIGILKDNHEIDREIIDDIHNEYQKVKAENEQLKSENKRLTDKLNKTALELVDECISQGKATEISEMSYREFLDYRAENGKPMELHL